MALTDGYGVLIGTKSDYFRDPPDHFGRYYHGNLIIKAPKGNYRCAIDLDPKFMPDGVEWRVVKIRARDFAVMKALQNQGDPIGSGHDSENAIWQDGGTIVETSLGNFVGFLNKFKTQSFRTDDQGRPL